MPQRTGTASLPLHWGKAPPWLFKRMVKLSGAIAEVIATGYSQQELLRRLSDPLWFQAFGCVLGFDWHSSGLTTTVTGALKESLKTNDIGIAVCGGKGAESKKTPTEIENHAITFSLSTTRINQLIYSSKMAAKVDSAAIQDFYQLYHHAFFFSEKGDWAVVQQGMNEQNRYARRYHWLSESMSSFVEEPHSAICCDARSSRVLDMTAAKSADARTMSVEVLGEIESYSQNGLHKFFGSNTSAKSLQMPAYHNIIVTDKRNIESLKKAAEAQPKDYEQLLAQPGIGPKTVRSLALISELVYGKPPSWEDPARFAFAHGGKDGVPFEVDRRMYDSSIEVLRTAIDNAKINSGDKLQALKRLSAFA